jgi:DNA primase
VEDQQRDWIDKLQSISISPIQLAVNKLDKDTYRPSYRLDPKHFKEIVDHRTILSNEIVFDFDHKVYLQNYKNARLIINALEERAIPYYIFSTGGKGIHISIFFDKLSLKTDEVKKLYKEALSFNFTWMHIRQWLYKTIIDESGMDNNGKKILDPQLVNFNELFDGTH